MATGTSSFCNDCRPPVARQKHPSRSDAFDWMVWHILETGHEDLMFSSPNNGGWTRFTSIDWKSAKLS